MLMVDTRDLPVPAQEASAHARVSDLAKSSGRSRLTRPSVLPSVFCKTSALGSLPFRGSMAGLCSPLSTLRRCPHGPLRMTRGRCGSLLLHRRGLAPPTSCRSPGAHKGGQGQEVNTQPLSGQYTVWGRQWTSAEAGGALVALRERLSKRVEQALCHPCGPGHVSGIGQVAVIRSVGPSVGHEPTWSAVDCMGQH